MLFSNTLPGKYLNLPERKKQCSYCDFWRQKTVGLPLPLHTERDMLSIFKAAFISLSQSMLQDLQLKIPWERCPEESLRFSRPYSLHFEQTYTLKKN